MPPISRILEILFYSMAIFIPWLFVSLYPFRNQLRANSNLVAFLAALMAAARIAVDLTAALAILGNALLVHLILFVLYALFIAVSVRGSLLEVMINLLIVLVLAFVTTTGIRNLEKVLTPSLDHQSYSWAYTVILLALNGIVAVIYSFVYQPVQSLVKKAFRKTAKDEESVIEESAAEESITEETVTEESTPEEAADEPAAPKKRFFPFPKVKKDEAIEEDKEEQSATAPAVEENKPEPAPVPAAEEKKPEPVPAPAAEEKKPEPAPVPAAEEKKPEPVPAVVAEEKKPEPAPVVEAKEEANSDSISTDQLLSMQYTNFNSRILESRQLRSNVRRSVDSMTESLNSKNYDKLRAQMLALRQQVTTTSYSKDFVLSVTLDYFAQICSNRGIHMNVNILLPDDVSNIVNPNDLIIILGNLLDNALDACKLQRNTDRHIMVAGNLYGKTLRLVVENTYEHPITQNEDGTYQSTKYDAPGAGLKMVRSIAECYNGDVKIDHTNGIFQVTVTLNV